MIASLTVLDYVRILAAIGSFVWSMNIMKATKSKTPADSAGLTGNTKIFVWITCLIFPLVSGAVYYYGWKKTLPTLAKQANNISWIAFGIYLILYYALPRFF